MKRISLLIIMSLLLVTTCYAQKENGGSIKFETTTHDFGNIKEDGGPQEYKFKFTNEGDAPITIKSARAECGCTRPSYPRTEILPGQSDYIKVTYHPKGNKGGFTKAITVRTTGNPGKVVLKIRGTVIPGK